MSLNTRIGLCLIGGIIIIFVNLIVRGYLTNKYTNYQINEKIALSLYSQESELREVSQACFTDNLKNKIIEGCSTLTISEIANIEDKPYNDFLTTREVHNLKGINCYKMFSLLNLNNQFLLSKIDTGIVVNKSKVINTRNEQQIGIIINHLKKMNCSK